MPQAFNADLSVDHSKWFGALLVNQRIFKLGDVRVFLFLMRGRGSPIHKGLFGRTFAAMETVDDWIDVAPCRKWYNCRMAKKLTDLSQLTKAILRESPPPRSIEKPAPEPSQSREDADTAAVLAYFSRPSQNAPQRKRAASCAVPAKDRPVAPVAALEARDAALAALAEEKTEAAGGSPNSNDSWRKSVKHTLEASVRQCPGHDVEDPVRLPGESQ